MRNISSDGHDAFLQEKIGSWYEGVTPLRSFIQGLQKKLEDRKVTIIVQGLQKYYRFVQINLSNIKFIQPFCFFLFLDSMFIFL